MIEEYGYETNQLTRTFDTYNDVDCYNYADLHDYIKYLKRGYGKVTDHASREIRLRRMTREQGIAKVKEFGFKEPKSLQLFLDWLGISENSFHYIMNQHRNKEIWQLNNNWEWELTNNLIIDQENAGEEQCRLKPLENFVEFLLTPKKTSSDPVGKYILIGRGYQ